MWTMFQDERGNYSTPRVLLTVIVVYVLAVKLINPNLLTTSFWTWCAGVCLGLMSWAGGARIAQYIGPQISGFAASFTRKEMESSTDIQELSKHAKKEVRSESLG